MIAYGTFSSFQYFSAPTTPTMLISAASSSATANTCQRLLQVVRNFYSHTFWANSQGQKVCMAALALAKRFVNVDQVFFFLGPGGVGLSLTTAHLDAMLGSSNHKYFDPQVQRR